MTTLLAMIGVAVLVTGIGSSATADSPVGATNSGSAAQLKADAPLPRSYSVNTKDRVFFITIDDGNYKPRSALAYVRAHLIPVTAFVTDAAIRGDWRYFRSITAQGGSVQNHTMTHKSLVSPSTNLSFEICKAQQIYTQQFDRAPTLLRPPYGYAGYAGTSKATLSAIGKTARSCGINRMAMWNATVDNGHFTFLRGSLTRGDIVLFHFKPNLANELKAVMAMAKRKGLRPASLADYLS